MDFHEQIMAMLKAGGCEEVTGDREDRSHTPRWLRWLTWRGEPVFEWDEPRATGGVCYPLWTLQIAPLVRLSYYPPYEDGFEMPSLEWAFEVWRFRISGSSEWYASYRRR